MLTAFLMREILPFGPFSSERLRITLVDLTVPPREAESKGEMLWGHRCRQKPFGGTPSTRRTLVLVSAILVSFL